MATFFNQNPQSSDHSFAVERRRPETIDEVRTILNAEYRYWQEQDSGESIYAMGAIANVLMALNCGLFAPWQVVEWDEKYATPTGEESDVSNDRDNDN